MSLVLIGVSVANGLGGGRGPRLLHSEGEALCRVKKTHDEVFAQLQRIGREGAAGEAVILNTCHRIELYAWLTRAGDAADRECAVARMRHQLLGEEPDGLRVNVLFGADAWHHLMRTIVGLNSGLPGDTDVIEQFRTACRIAEHAGVGGARLRRLLAEAADLEQGVRTGTAWGRFAAGYCLAAIRRACQLAGLDPASCRHVVIGGSTTSRSILAALSDGFDVSKRQMTLVYRGHHGGQIKQLRAAIGNGKRVRVQSYSEDAVIEAISGADVVYFGIDRNEPVLTAEALRTARQFADKPLMIVDFNSFGSTESVAELDGVTAWDARRLEQEVESLAEQQCADPQFHQAVQEAEQWIEERLPAMAAPFLKLPCAARRASVRPDCNSCWIGRHTIPAGSSAS